MNKSEEDFLFCLTWLLKMSYSSVYLPFLFLKIKKNQACPVSVSAHDVAAQPIILPQPLHCRARDTNPPSPIL